MKRLEIPDAVEGTRGLLLGTGLLLLGAMAEPALPAGFPRWLHTIPALVLLAIGLGTLPRDGLAAYDRAVRLADAPDWRVIARRLAWIAITVALLLPRLFLAGYGIPHLNPIVGLAPQQWVIRLATVFLFVALLAPILYLRAGRRGSAWPRPHELPEGDPQARRHDALLVGVVLTVVVWALLLRPFWTPFSLLQWPPEFWSLAAGARGVAALAFAVVIPAVLFTALAVNAGLLRRLLAIQASPQRTRCLALVSLHLGLTLLAAFLHGYDLLWIARYESLALF